MDNKAFNIGDLVLLRNDWDHFGLGIVTKVLTMDEIIDIFNENILTMAIHTNDKIYKVCFSKGTEMSVFGREIRSAK